MKLIGSVMEADFRKELLESHQYHFSENSESRLKELLEKAGHSTERAFVLHWTPDQTEDFYSVLIGGEYLVSTEIEKMDLAANSPITTRNISNQSMKRTILDQSNKHTTNLSHSN